MPIGKRLFATAFVTMMVAILFIGMAQPAEAVGDTGTIGLMGGNIELDVSPGASGSVTFNGQVDIINIYSYQVTVNLQASSQLGAAVSLSPPTLIFAAGESSKSFQVQLKMRIGTSYSSADIITVSGTLQPMYGASTPLAPATQLINIKQFFRITVSSETPYIEIGPGQQVFIPLRIDNQGNGEDTFIVKVEDDSLKALTEKGWAVQIGMPKIVIEEKLNKPITITATSPQGTTIWKNEITMIKLHIISENSGGFVKEEYQIYIRENGMRIPGFDPTFALLSLSLVGVALLGRRQKPFDPETDPR